MQPFADLAPPSVWQHFARLCAIPRPSGHEGAIRSAIATWAEQLGLTVLQDEGGNLLLRKAATPGHEAAPGVVLQGHLDMVCQVRRGVSHDFLRDPIQVLRDGDWLSAPDTTLGADNGIGVALGLAALEDSSLTHGPLEVLLTVDEESGMSGARALAPDWLQGRLLLNLDTEDWGEFYVGCAGGADVNIRQRFAVTEVAEDFLPLRLDLNGLRGGHSGVDIHLGRGNALMLLVETLQRLQSVAPIRLAGLAGGTARNAIPRDAEAHVWLPRCSLAQALSVLQQQADALAPRLASTDPDVALSWQEAVDLPARALSAADSHALLATLAATPQGVARFSDALPGVVETSCNLGVLNLADGQMEACCLVRSLVDRECSRLADAVAAGYRAGGAEALIDGAYPGWQPQPDAPLLALCRAAFARRHGGEARIKVIHAGLECGLLGGLYPDMQMVSFGPDIRGAHAPGERVHIPTVEHCWTLLRDILETIAVQR